MTLTTTATHWHVKRHDGDDDVFAGDLAGALDYAETEMTRVADHEHEGITACGEAEDFEEAYASFKRSEAYAGLAANLDNIHKQRTLPVEKRAPLYRGDDAETRAKLDASTARVIDTVNAQGPDGFSVYGCAEAECDPTRVQYCVGEQDVTAHMCADEDLDVVRVWDHDTVIAEFTRDGDVWRASGSDVSFLADDDAADREHASTADAVAFAREWMRRD